MLHTPARPVPLPIALAYTAFMAVLVPTYYLNYGPTNFLYFCDVALFLALAAVWTSHPLPGSMAAVGILLPQALWCVDFLGTMFGWPVVGMTGYMFDETRSLFLRGLSFFHFWLPFFLLYLVWQLGYDRRALLGWTVLAWMLIAICYLGMPGPAAGRVNTHIPVNINYVHGFSDEVPQAWMRPHFYVFVVAVVLPVVVYLPTHLLLMTLFRRESATGNAAPAESAAVSG